jgi:shikimate kinase
MVRKIVLVGYMGVGKTKIGKELEKKLNLRFVDLDELIEEKENKSIAEVFEQKGELYFRKVEHQLFSSLLQNEDSFILGTGGGTPCYYNNHLLLENDEVASFFLKASIDTLYQRLVNEKKLRPLLSQLSESDLKEFIGKHLFERNFYYQKATYKIDVDNKNPQAISSEIISKLL